MKRTSH